MFCFVFCYSINQFLIIPGGRCTLYTSDYHVFAGWTCMRIEPVQGSLTCIGDDCPCAGGLQLTSRSERLCTVFMSSLTWSMSSLTWREACSDTKIFTPPAGIPSRTSEASALTTELPHYHPLGKSCTLWNDQLFSLHHYLFLTLAKSDFGFKGWACAIS